jgi:outer membrane protein
VKKYILLLAVLILGGNNLFSQAAAGLKIGYVDSQVIFAQLPEAIKVQGDLDALFKTWNATADSMTQVYQQNIADYQKKANTMPEAKKTEEQKKIVELEQTIVEYKKAKFGQGGEAYQKQDQLLKPIKDKIMTAIGNIAKEEGMQFVFDKVGDSSFLLFADSSFDVTYKVLDRLKRGK